MLKRQLLIGVAASLLVASGSAAGAQEVLKLGLVLSMTGAFNTAGKAVVNGALLYLKQHGDTVAGRKVQVIVKDDASTPDAAKRLAQELVVNDKAAILGVGFTPSALAVAPFVTEAKISTVALLSAASATLERSPYMVRTTFTGAQSSATIASWAVKNGAKKIVTLVNDWAPGLEAEAAFKERVTQEGAEIVESIRVPLANPDFAPFLQRVKDDNPDTLFIGIPGFPGFGEFLEHAMNSQGVKS